MAEQTLPMRERVAEAYNRLGGNISAVRRELGIQRSTIRFHLKKLGVKKPVAGGSMDGGVKTVAEKLPAKGKVKRYILTSAQNNTHLNEAVWDNLLALSKHYDARLIVGTYTYNQNAYGKLSVKRGTHKERESDLWYDTRIEPFVVDHRIELGHGLVWCGEMNIQPTAPDPLSNLESYSGRNSAIFPHAKLSMRSVAAMKGEGVKLNYTTGTVTLMNYIQKKAGLVGEHHHIYGGVIVEVDSDGHWWVRQLDADSNGTLHDLDLRVENGKVKAGNRIEAITWGDLHATRLDPKVSRAALGKGGMLEFLMPKFQFVHDVLAGDSVNHHASSNPHEQYRTFLRGYTTVLEEMVTTANVLWAYDRDFVETVVVDSNHDAAWLNRWLREHDYRRDPVNAVFFLETQLQTYLAIRDGHPWNIVKWSIEKGAMLADEKARGDYLPAVKRVKFLGTDDSFKTCGGMIENGLHGHLGPNGSRGTPANLNKIGRRSNTGHTHSAGIFNGLFVAGTSTVLDWGYNIGPSSWSQSHILTYPNGKRTIITLYNGKWRA